MTRFDRRRADMVRRQLVARGIADPDVLAAMGAVPREAFVPSGMQGMAYRDGALPIQAGQTISQPYIVALMAEALELRPTHRVLEIGTGSGYAAAVLSRIAAEVHTVERIPELARAAADRLRTLGYGNVTVHEGDGTLGWALEGPYDGICVAAAAPEVPEALVSQLTTGGRLVVPVGPPHGLQVLTRVRRTADGPVREILAEVRFVPLIGEQGWEDVP